ncbi:MAG: MoaD/ThiS family protein [Planctomycetota bacterium]
MNIRVKYSGQLRAATRCGDEEIAWSPGGTLAELIAHLAERHSAGRPHLLSDIGAIRPSLLIAVNDSAVAASDANAIRLRDGDTVWLLPPIAGG